MKHGSFTAQCKEGSKKTGEQAELISSHRRSEDIQDIELITSMGYLIARESATQRVQQRPPDVSGLSRRFLNVPKMSSSKARRFSC
jgi:hypothetical protein